MFIIIQIGNFARLTNKLGKIFNCDKMQFFNFMLQLEYFGYSEWALKCVNILLSSFYTLVTIENDKNQYFIQN